MKTYLKSLITIFVVLASHQVFAASTVTPLSVGIMPPVQFPSDDFTVTGLRLSLLYGRHRNLYGLDFGLLGNVTDQEFVGAAVSGLVNKTGGKTNILGLQFAGIANVNSGPTSVVGLQAALVLNSQTAVSSVVGLQFAAVNYVPFTDIYGVQVGLYNKAKEVYGFQIGLVNMAENLHGIQIGLINFNNKGLVSVCPIINIGF